MISYSDYIAEQLNNTITYSEYIAEQHTAITYSEYIAEQLNILYKPGQRQLQVPTVEPDPEPEMLNILSLEEYADHPPEGYKIHARREGGVLVCPPLPPFP